MATVKTRYPQSNLAACMLPWTEDFRLDVAKFEQHVQAALNDGYRCLYVMGTAGEGYALSEQRFQQVVEVFAAQTVKGGIDPQIGVIGLSMEQIILRLKFAHSLGIRMFQISLPSWGALDESETLLFFKAVCGEFPDSRFLHYNLPRTKRIITGPEYHRIALQVPNLVATKNSTTDYARTADLLLNSPELQHFLLEGNFAMGCTLGECSLLCSYDSLFPKTTWQFFEAGRSKNLAELFRITQFFHEVGAKLFAHCKRPMIDGSYDKTFLWLRDPMFSNRVLPPYLGLSEDESLECRRIFDECYRNIL
jgi:dihydrodipicolinate synthase/N-acetylneuraminate lyase